MGASRHGNSGGVGVISVLLSYTCSPFSVGIVFSPCVTTTPSGSEAG
jgi:hypothetical protein